MAAAIAAAVAVYALWIWFRIGGDYPTAVVDDVGVTAAGFLAGVAAVRRGRSPADRMTGWGWMVLGIAMLLNGLAFGQLAYLEVVARTGSASLPATAAVLFDAASAGQIVAVLLLFGQGVGGLRPRLLLDGGIAAGALLLISWYAVLRAAYQASSSLFDMVPSWFGQISDVVTVVLVLSALAHTRRLDPARLLIGAGIGAFACSDTTIAFSLTTGGAWVRLVDVGYFTGLLLLAAATLVDTPPALDHAGATRASWQIALPYVPLMGAGGLVLGRLLTNQPLDVFTEVVIAAMVALLLGRQFLAVAETRALAVRLEETAERWKTASTEREIVIDNAPVGIGRLDAGGRLLTANNTLRRILGHQANAVVGRHLRELVHPDDRLILDADDGSLGGTAGEARFVRGDGTLAWCAYATVAVPGVAGLPDTGIAIVEDVNERRQDAERAAAVQRQLLPHGAPSMVGYELVGTCVPSLNVAGDFYDWVVGEGRVDIMLADVMGKGMGAALVTAALRSALRAAPPALGPGRRLALAADTMALGLEGLFVTIVLARLDLRTGSLRYVDAGHGHCAVRRECGDLVRLETRSMPLGIEASTEFTEGEIGLAPGDSLLLYSDGLVETDAGTLPPESLHPYLVDAVDARELLHRMIATVPSRPADDVTAVVLRRLPLPLPQASEPAPAGVAGFQGAGAP
jgi:PAS domain S-box-containing protein